MANLRLNKQTNEILNEAGEVVGTLVKEATPAEVAKAEVYAESGKLGSWLKNNTRTIEKYLAYGAGLVGATNGFAQLAMPTGIRTGLIAVAGLVVAADKING
jgi:hypothetical protein